MQDSYHEYFSRLFATHQFRDISKSVNYVVSDTETTDANPHSCYIMQLGYCIVTNGVLDMRGGYLLQLPDEVEINPGAAHTHGITRTKCAEQGCDRIEGLRMFFDVLKLHAEHGYLMVGHNIIKFDWALYLTEAKRYGMDFSEVFKDPSNLFLDTGMMAKAAQLYAPSRTSVLPYSGDTRASYFNRISGIRAKGVLWNLDFCRKHFELDKHCEAVRCMLNMHDAETDCVVTHCMLEHFLNAASKTVPAGA